jgi:hypothetical protein
MCVFAWGLRYKLSLYDPPHSITRHMPAAKLLTGNERRAVAAVDLRPASGLPVLAFLGALVFSVLFFRRPRLIPAFGSSALFPARRPAVPAWAPYGAKFIRPPPRIL